MGLQAFICKINNKKDLEQAIADCRAHNQKSGSPMLREDEIYKDGELLRIGKDIYFHVMSPGHGHATENWFKDRLVNGETHLHWLDAHIYPKGFYDQDARQIVFRADHWEGTLKYFEDELAQRQE